MNKILLAILSCSATAVLGFSGNAEAGDKEADNSNSRLIEAASQDAPRSIVVMGELDFDWNEFAQGGDITVDCFTANMVCMVIEIPETGDIKVLTNGIVDPFFVSDYSSSEFPGGETYEFSR